MPRGFKTGGRQKGTPNYITKEIKEVLKQVLNNELNNIPIYLSALKEKEKLEIIIKLLPYVIPKIQSIEVKEKPKEKMTLEEIDAELKRLGVEL